MRALRIFAALLLCLGMCHLASGFDGSQWFEGCDATIDMQGPFASEALLISENFVHDQGNNTYAIDHAPFLTGRECNGLGCALRPLATDSVWYGDDQVGTAATVGTGRSGVLVGPDIVLTAPHCTTAYGCFDPTHYYAIFKLHSQVNGAGQCVQPDLSAVPKSSVYKITQVLGNSFDAGPLVFIPHDYMTVKLDRPVTFFHNWLRIRRSGSPHEGDLAWQIGHPAHLASAKIDPAGELFGIAHPFQESPAEGAVQMNGTHSLDGSSGSMVYNATAGYIEAVVAEDRNSCANYQLSSTQSGKYFISLVCPTQSYYINGLISDIADSIIPAYTLDTRPLDDVLHVAAKGATVTNQVTQYQLRAPSTALTSINWTISPPADAGSPNPKLSLFAVANSGTVSPGQTVSFQTIANPIANCGRYTDSFQVFDTSYGYSDTIVHKFEIGLTDFALTLPTTETFQAIVAPSIPSTLVYIVTNVRPSPVNFRVNSDQTWLTVDAPASSPAGITLMPAGQSGSTATVTVRLGAGAYALSNGNYSAKLTFTNLSECPVSSSVQRAVSFVKGTITVESDVEADLPHPTGTTPLSSSIQIPESFCISDASVTMQMWSATGSRPSLSELAPNLNLYVDKLSTIFHGWSDNAIPSGWNIPSYSGDIIPGAHGVFETLVLDNSSHLPPNGARTTIFNNRNASGSWALRLYDDNTTPRTSAYIVKWGLRLTGAQGSCVQ